MLYNATQFFRKFWTRILFYSLGIGSLIWFLARVIPKPSRATYPCMRAAAPMASSFIAYLIGIGTFTLLMRKARDRFRNAKYLIASLFIVAGFGVGLLSIVVNNAKLNAQPLVSTLDANTPLGEGKGIFPGRVVWVHNSAATNEDCSNDVGDYWSSDSNTDQEVVDEMLAQGILSVAGTEDLSVAWDSIFHSYNRTHARGNNGYVAGEKIVIKINLNGLGNSYTSSPPKNINTSPQLAYALLDHLVNTVGVAETDICIGDPNVSMGSVTYNKLHGSFPNVTYWGNGSGLTSVVSTGAKVFFSSDGVVEDVLPQAYIDATYMINVPVFKKHHRAGISLNSKNHFGSIAPFTNGAWHLHYSLPCPEATSVATNGDEGVYRCFVDIMGHKDLGGKTIINIVDGIWGSTNWGHPPVKFAMLPFNNDWPNSLFISQDPVAVQSVCFDFLFEEFDEDHPTEGTFQGDDKGPYPHFPGTTDFLQQAADPSLWPAGINYDPEKDGSILTSLGTHEHWNNAAEKKYSRNLGTGEGIELFKVSMDGQITPENSDLLSEKVVSIYVDSFNVKWFGTDRGVSRYDGTEWTGLTTETTGIGGEGLLSNHVRNIAYEKTGYGHEIWLSTDAGLSVASFGVDGVSAATTYTTENSDILSNDVLSVGVDIKHNRWAGTPLGLSVFMGSDWTDTIVFMDEDHSWIDFADVTIGAMAAYDRDSMIYIATDSAGVLRFEHDEIDGYTGASAYSAKWSQISKTVNSITVRDTVQWYGTPIGAFMHLGNQAKSYWIHYPVDSGLISPNVTAIELDDLGNVWMGTDKGLSIKTASGWLQYPGGMQASNLNFNADTMNVEISWMSGTGLSDKDGLVHPKVNDIKKDFEGKIWVATDGGVETFSAVPTKYGTEFSAKRLVFMKEGNSGDLYLTDGITYVANTEFGAGTEISGSGWYCVYNGTGSEVTVSGLAKNREYKVMVVEYTGEAGSELYVSDESEGNPATFSTDKGYDGIIGFDDESIRIYPVPFIDYIIISGPALTNSGRVSIYSLDGKLQQSGILNSQSNRINTSDLKKGIYFLQIIDGDKSYSCKIRK